MLLGLAQMRHRQTHNHHPESTVSRANPQPPRIALLSLLLIFLALSVHRSEALSYCVNYSATPDLEELKRFDEVILSPDARVDVHSLIRSAQLPYAYLSVVEIASDARYRDKVKQLGIRTIGANTTWGSDVMDLSDPKWANFIVDVLAKDAVDKGFRGFFLDTIDSIAIAEKAEPAKRAQFREGLLTLIKRLKSTYPDRNIIANSSLPIRATTS